MTDNPSYRGQGQGRPGDDQYDDDRYRQQHEDARGYQQRPGGYPAGGWYPEQRLTVQETLEAYCVGPAVASGEAAEKGRIAPGMLADLAVLTGDPFRSAPGELHAITAAMTLVEGKLVFER